MYIQVNLIKVEALNLSEHKHIDLYTSFGSRLYLDKVNDLNYISMSTLALDSGFSLDELSNIANELGLNVINLKYLTDEGFIIESVIEQNESVPLVEQLL